MKPRATGSGKMHEPVMLDEVMELLRPSKGEKFVDATAGTGGFVRELALKVGAEGVVVAIEWDRKQAEVLQELAREMGNVKVVSASHSELDEILKKEGISQLDGVVFDCGVSSFQLGDIERGFSISGGGRLDMRMSDGLDTTAEDIINSWSRSKLAKLFREIGGERYALRIASAIVKERESARIRTSAHLSSIIQRKVPRRGKLHPATRVFMALRKAVNREEENLYEGLRKAFKALRPGGRLAVLTFESGEARIVKEFASEVEEGGSGALVTRKALTPSEEERKRNPRSRSAKLRVIEKRVN